MDEDIVKHFASVTGKMSRTKVVAEGDNRRIERTDTPGENSFKELHDLMQATGDKIKVTVEYKEK